MTRRLPRWERFEDEDDGLEDEPRSVSTSDDRFEFGAALGGLEIRVKSRRLKSGRVTAVFAGVTLDLRDAVLAPEGATLSLQSAVSGIDILVPGDWHVDFDVDAVCSGVGGDRAPPSANPPRLKVTGTIVAGGLCVR